MDLGWIPRRNVYFACRRGDFDGRIYREVIGIPRNEILSQLRRTQPIVGVCQVIHGDTPHFWPGTTTFCGTSLHLWDRWAYSGTSCVNRDQFFFLRHRHHSFHTAANDVPYSAGTRLSSIFTIFLHISPIIHTSRNI